MATLQTTRVNRSWFIKRFLFPLIALAGLGTWGLFDAVVAYPRNGRQDASLKLRNFLQSAEDARKLVSGVVKSEDPDGELAKLKARESATAAAEILSPMEKAKLEWLKSLKMMWATSKPEIWIADVKRALVSKTGSEVYSGVGGVSEAKQELVTLMYRPKTGEGVMKAADGSMQVVPIDATFKQLKDYWSANKITPSPLAFYDLPMQWLFVVVGYGGAVYLLLIYVKVVSRKYSYDAEAHALTMPDGVVVTPGDLKEIDKRKWHKFFATMILKSEKTYTLDLLRYVPLEDWVLEMERIAFPELAEEEGTAAESAPDGEGVKPSVPKDVGKVAAMNYGGAKEGRFAIFLFDPRGADGLNRDPAAYAQGETLKALGAHMSRADGWNQWLTAGLGVFTRDAGPGRDGLETLRHWLRDKDPANPTSSELIDPAFKGVVAGGSDPGFDPVYVAVGRLTDESIHGAHDSLGDPPAAGYLGVLMTRPNPPTIEQLSKSLGFDIGREIKGSDLIGAWKATAEDVTQAGLKAASSEPV